jgi:hypothetical protein
MNCYQHQKIPFIVIAAIREASDAGDFHLKTKSRDFRVIFDEK